MRPSTLFATTMIGVVSVRSQRAIQTLPRIDQEQRRIGITHGRLGLGAHSAGQGMRLLVLEPRGVDHAKVQSEQFRLTLPAIARHSRPIIDQRKALTDETVEQGRFADVGSADDCDGRDHAPPIAVRGNYLKAVRRPSSS